MLSNDFAQKHRLCEFGMSQLNMNTNRPLKDMWFDESMPTSGTILMWIASRAQHDKKALIRCTGECVRETASLASGAKAEAEQAIDTVLGWCDGSRSRDDVEAVTRDALEKAKAAAKRAGGEVDRQLWAAVSSLSRCVRSVGCCSGAISAAATVGAVAGQSADDWQKRLAAKIRSMLPWDDVEASIRADKTSPRPRQKTADEVAAESQKILAEFETLLNSLQAAQQQKAELFASAGASPEKVRSFIASGKLGSRNEQVFREKLAEIEAQDAVPTDSGKPGAAPPRRQRMIV